MAGGKKIEDESEARRCLLSVKRSGLAERSDLGNHGAQAQAEK